MSIGVELKADYSRNSQLLSEDSTPLPATTELAILISPEVCKYVKAVSKSRRSIILKPNASFIPRSDTFGKGLTKKF